MILLNGSEMYERWGPRTRKTARSVLRNVRASRMQRRLNAKCNELQSQLDDAHAELKQIESERDEIRQIVAEYELQLRHLRSEIQRAHSDAQRSKRSAAQDEMEAASKAKLEVAKRIMTVADDFTSAIEVAEDQKMDPRWFDGFKAMAEKIDNCLVSEGYRRFESLGEDMDPSRHEALATMPTSDEDSGKVIQVIEAGYEDAATSKVVRVAKVLVGRQSGDA